DAAAGARSVLLERRDHIGEPVVRRDGRATHDAYMLVLHIADHRVTCTIEPEREARIHDLVRCPVPAVPPDDRAHGVVDCAAHAETAVCDLHIPDAASTPHGGSIMKHSLVIPRALVLVTLVPLLAACPRTTAAVGAGAAAAAAAIAYSDRGATTSVDISVTRMADATELAFRDLGIRLDEREPQQDGIELKGTDGEWKVVVD